MIDVQKLAREADLSSMTADAHCREDYWTATRAELERFAALVLEEAAKVCEERAGTVSMFANSREASAHNQTVRGCAAAIRSLKPKGGA